jgi:hypothetical protein
MSNEYLRKARRHLELYGEEPSHKNMVRSILAGVAQGRGDISSQLVDGEQEEISREDMMSALEDMRVTRDVRRAIEITKRRNK